MAQTQKSPVTIKSNAQDVMARINELGNFTEPEKRQITRAMARVYIVDMKKRTSKGISTDGSSFRDYSTTPMYAVKRRGILKAIGTPWGKEFNGRKRSKFASGKKKGQRHRSRYLPRGYEQLRQLTGRNTRTDRLTFDGLMQADLSEDGYGKGGAVVHYPRDEENQKATGNQLRYNFFFPTKQEKERQFREGQLEIEHITEMKGFKEV